ncbi:MAG: hypothetical protein Q8S84_02270 [bacterium]|nr:hypothetical protein [bacterium]
MSQYTLNAAFTSGFIQYIQSQVDHAYDFHKPGFLYQLQFVANVQSLQFLQIVSFHVIVKSFSLHTFPLCVYQLLQLVTIHAHQALPFQVSVAVAFAITHDLVSLTQLTHQFSV